MRLELGEPCHSVPELSKSQRYIIHQGSHAGIDNHIYTYAPGIQETRITMKIVWNYLVPNISRLPHCILTKQQIAYHTHS